MYYNKYLKFIESDFCREARYLMRSKETPYDNKSAFAVAMLTVLRRTKKLCAENRRQGQSIRAKRFFFVVHRLRFGSDPGTHRPFGRQKRYALHIAYLYCRARKDPFGRCSSSYHAFYCKKRGSKYCASFRDLFGRILQSSENRSSEILLCSRS